MTSFQHVIFWLLLAVPGAALRSVGEAEDAPVDPTAPGCYVWMPTGCSNNSVTGGLRGKDVPDFWGLLDHSGDMSLEWVRDAHGIEKHQAGTNQQACEQTRRMQFNQWCQRDNAQMKFVPGLEPVKPMTPGCYLWFPSGCRRHQFHAKTQWRKIGDTKKAECEETAPNKYNSWCGNNDARSLFVRDAPTKPRTPGCYVWMPTGCSQHPFASKLSWKLDGGSEGATQALTSRLECEVERRKHWNNYCGESNARMYHVPLDASSKYKEPQVESMEERHAAPASSDLPDVPDRGATESEDSEPVTFPVGAPSQPEKPGCYVWMPHGCQNQRFHARVQWRPTPFDNADECASKGRAQYSSWCGNQDVQMLWVGSEEPMVGQDDSHTSATEIFSAAAVARSSSSASSTSDVDGTYFKKNGGGPQSPPVETTTTASGDDNHQDADGDDAAPQTSGTKSSSSKAPAGLPSSGTESTTAEESSSSEAPTELPTSETDSTTTEESSSSKGPAGLLSSGTESTTAEDSSSSQGPAGLLSSGTQSTTAEESSSSKAPAGLPSSGTESTTAEASSSSEAAAGFPTSGTESTTAEESSSSEAPTRLPTSETDSTTTEESSSSKAPAGLLSSGTESTTAEESSSSKVAAGLLTSGTESTTAEESSSSKAPGGLPTSRTESTTGEESSSSKAPAGLPTSGTESTTAEESSSSKVAAGFPTSGTESTTAEESSSSKAPGGHPTSRTESTTAEESSSSKAPAGLPTSVTESTTAEESSSSRAAAGFPTSGTESTTAEESSSSKGPAGLPSYGTESTTAEESSSSKAPAGFSTSVTENTTAEESSSSKAPAGFPTSRRESTTAEESSSNEAPVGFSTSGTGSTTAEESSSSDAAAAPPTPEADSSTTAEVSSASKALAGLPTFGTESTTASESSSTWLEQSMKGVRAHFVREEYPASLEEPTEPGCYVMMPTGCDVIGRNASVPRDGDTVYGDDLDANTPSRQERQWRRDDHGIKFKKAGVDQQACEERRREQYNHYCQRTDIQLKFIAGMAPTKPMLSGCYVWLPTGCPKHRFHAKTMWRRVDETNRSECETSVARRYNSWCVRDDAQALFISSPPRKPTEPGCYVWMPTGCIQHTLASQMWKLDQIGLDAQRATIDKAYCEVERKQHWNKFCGESNARMAYIGATNRPASSESQDQFLEERKYQ